LAAQHPADHRLPGRDGAHPDFRDALRHTAFHVSRWPPPPAYASYDYAKWPLFAPLLMILLGCFATCAGSTGGGIKMIRMLLLAASRRGANWCASCTRRWSTRS
jgi:hypothetical protein